MLRWLIPLLLTTATAYAQPKQRLLVMDMRGERDVDVGVVKLLSELLINEFHTLERYVVTGERDLQSMLELENKRDLLGCEHDHCVTQLAGALGADLAVASSVGKIGDSYLMNVKLFDGASGQPLRRFTRRMRADENTLIDAARDAVRLIAGLDAAPPPGEEVSSSSDRTAWPWIVASLAVAGAASGATFSVLARDGLGVSPAALAYPEAVQGAESKAMAANVSFGVAAGAAVVSTVLFVLGY